jgi:drug/metabolite transporter (DMT)-like permease
MGGAGALFGIAWVINSSVIAPIVNHNILLPFILAGLSFLVGALLMSRHRPIQADNKQ